MPWNREHPKKEERIELGDLRRSLTRRSGAIASERARRISWTCGARILMASAHRIHAMKEAHVGVAVVCSS